MQDVNTPGPGFGAFEVPEMPAYVQSYTKRGEGFTGQTTPVMTQTRFGNPRYIGGMDAYISQLENPTYFDSLKQKKGDAGVFEALRWTPGQDWRGGFGLASLDAQKNAALSTRGGEMRQGGPKRSDYMDREGFWFETARPGLSVSRVSQANENFAGIYEDKRRTPFIERDVDALVLREMIEKNPFHISSHAAKSAKAMYDREFPYANNDTGSIGYDSGIRIEDNLARDPVSAQAASQNTSQLENQYFVSNPW